MLEGTSSPVFVGVGSLCHFQASLSVVSSTASVSVVLKDFFISDINLLCKGLCVNSSSVITLSGVQQKYASLSDSFWGYLRVSVAVLPLLRKEAGRSIFGLAEQQDLPAWGNIHQGRKGSKLFSNTFVFSFLLR